MRRLSSFVKLSPDGQIGTVIQKTDGKCPEGYIEIKDAEQAMLLAGTARSLLYEDDEIVRKPVVKIRSDKMEIRSGSGDEVKIWLEGVPASTASVKLLVNMEEVDLANGETLTIAIERRGPVAVRIAPRQRVIGKELIIRGAL